MGWHPPALPDDFFKSARSDVKNRQNPPKSAKQNWSNLPEIRQKLG
jgi:hypothetical protein